jgi:putative flippase GtrA
MVASGIGYMAGLLNSYIVNRRWTFGSNQKKITEFSKFLMVNLVALTTNLVTLNISFVSFHIRPEIGQIIAICFSTGVNFTGNKYWTFRDTT